MNNDLINTHLFSSIAGEDEDPRYLEEYFYQGSDNEVCRFFEEKHKFLIAKSKKGVGKSTLLHATKIKKYKKNSVLTIYATASDIESMAIDKESMASEWRDKLSRFLNLHIAKDIKLAINDSEIDLVDNSVRFGIKPRNFVRFILDRFKFSIFGVSEKISNNKNQTELLTDYMSTSGISIWLMIDDIDINFISNQEQTDRIISFVMACKELSKRIDKLYIRASLRSSVWITLRTKAESLDKYDNYIFSIHWSIEDITLILQRQILAYFHLYSDNNVTGNFSGFDSLSDAYIQCIFPSSYRWSGKDVSPLRPISIYANGRPRWGVKLCRMAAELAVQRKHDIIEFRDFSSNLYFYSRQRLIDIYAEFKHQCKEVQMICEIFYQKSFRMSTRELLKTIKNELISDDKPIFIDQRATPASSIEIANFIYRIGLVRVREEHEESENKRATYYDYEERPAILLNPIHIPENIELEVALVFRYALQTTQSNKAISRG